MRHSVHPRTLLVAAAALAGACDRSAEGSAATGGRLSIATPYASAQAGAGEAAVYLTIRNAAGQADTLMHVNTPEAAGVSVHRSSTSGTLVTMERLDWLVVGANDSTVLAPGGTHLMLTGLKSKAPGDTIHLALSFVHAGTLVVSVPVYAPGESPEHQHQVP